MPGQLPSITQPRFVLHDSGLRVNQDQFAHDVRGGLTAKPKTLAPKYFYDALGSQLFEAICLLPEYYLTRSETEIFANHAAEIVAKLPGPVTIAELGSGSSLKTRLLIEAILKRQNQLHYQPIDISSTILQQSGIMLLGHYQNLRITAQSADYTRGLHSILRNKGEKLLILFLGSNIGNYKPEDALNLLRDIRHSVDVGDGLLLGADLKKSTAVLEKAYDDSLGVTKAFNLNLLLRINRELAGNFDVTRFAHRATYNKEVGCIETHLISSSAQTVTIADLGLKVDFFEGETIHTESSYKYDLSQLKAMAKMSGFESAGTWLDQNERFSCNLWSAV
jgi:L-histidine N-alpha-methyltransferase